MRLALLLLGIVFSSCALPKRDVYLHHPPLDKNNLSKINGDYDAMAWRKLVAGNFFRKNKDSSFVRLTVIDPSTIEARLMRGNVVLKKRTLAGTVDNEGYFSAKPRMAIIPIPLFFFYSHLRTDLILTENNNLFAHTCSRGFVMIFIIAGGANDCSSTEYSRLR